MTDEDQPAVPRVRSDASACCGPGSACTPPGIDRRSFLAWSGLSAAALAARPGATRPYAGPFGVEDFPIPADKELDPAWVASLAARGTPTLYTQAKGELDWIGMPLGGIGCGQVYLGGDGRHWHWDVFNLPPPEAFRSSSGAHYRAPAPPRSPFEQGFQLFARAGHRTWSRSLDRAGFPDVRFRGQYPIGFVELADPEVPFRVGLEAFAPFVPLWTDDSSLPAIVLEYTVENTGNEELEIELLGWIENRVAPATLPKLRGTRRNTIARQEGYTLLHGTCHALPPSPPLRPDIPFDDFERAGWDGWTATGTAFGSGPRKVSELPGYIGPVDAHGAHAVNTHATAHGEDVVRGDAHTGTLTSRPFTIERQFVTFRIGGGNHPGEACLDVLVEGAVVATATGRDANRMRFESLDVLAYTGKEARIEIVDRFTGGWGNVGVDEIVFSDEPRAEPIVLEDAPDFGTIALALLTPTGGARGAATLGGRGNDMLRPLRADESPEFESTYGERLVGGLSSTARLSPRAKAAFTFVIAWHVPGLPWESLDFIPDIRKLRRHYAARFANAAEVVHHVHTQREILFAGTRAWRATFYDRSTLPHWFLERTFASLSTVATATCLRFSNGRFYGWEGTYCCPGTCTHVWQYAQGLARIFPELERDLRERTDFGTAWHADTGLVDYRGEAARSLAIDGQCGTILRVLREHEMSKDADMLRRLWPRVKKSVELVLGRDPDQDGILDGEQYNTLDASWWGAIAWTSSLYVAALRAGEALAGEMGDAGFAKRCREVAERGSKNLVARLFDGEYFVHRADPEHPEANSTGTGCHIDQLLGQSFAHPLALPRVVPAREARSALASLWKYNFAPDIGPYRERFDAVIRGGRWYALPGEGGLLMCTWPKGGHASATGKGNEAWAAGYFNECMTGFEHQVAGHMLWEGLVQEGLAVERAIHDRYHAQKRNPWNEIECGDHYARAMASYGVYLAACGFELHGPTAHIGFAPRLTPERFQCAFTAPEGWGTFSQTQTDEAQVHRFEIAWGHLSMRSFAFEVPEGRELRMVEARFEPALPAQEGNHVGSVERRGRRVLIRLKATVDLAPGQEFVVSLA